MVGQFAGLLVGAFALAGAIGSKLDVGQFVVKLGPCSGALISAAGVLTSAHCLNGPIDQVVLGGKLVRVAKCEQHEGYRPGLPAHDLGYCRLEEESPGAIAIDDGPPPEIGESVFLAGFGLSSATSRDKPALRTIATYVVGVKEGWMVAGSAAATACRGDSGGPMLVERDGWRVAGVIHGAEGAICASPTKVVPVGPDRDWLLQRIDARPHGLPESVRRRGHVLLGVGLVVSAAVVASLWWRRMRRLRCS